MVICIDMNKVCKGCDVSKPLTDFYFRGGYYQGKCKSCQTAQHKKWARKNAAYLRKYVNNLYHTNEAYRKTCIRCARQYRNDPANKQHIKRVKQALAVKHRKNPKVRILSNLRRRVLFVLHGHQKSDHTLNLIGCSREQLVKHIESKFQDGMTWDNYGKWGWNIDHIIPCKLFDLSKPSEQRKCFHYTNLQPLWWKDNYQKGARYNQRPQPQTIDCGESVSQTNQPN